MNTPSCPPGARLRRRATTFTGVWFSLVLSCIALSLSLPLSLSSASDVCIPAQGKVLVPTDLALAVPDGCYGRIGITISGTVSVSLFHGTQLHVQAWHGSTTLTWGVSDVWLLVTVIVGPCSRCGGC